MFVKRGICGLDLKVPLFIVKDIGRKCNTYGAQNETYIED